MKYFFSILFITTTLFCSNVLAKRIPPSVMVKNTLERMFTMCELQNDSALAEYVIYRGDDTSRKWKDHCQVNAADEMRQVISLRNRINNYLLPNEYKFVEFTTQTESEGTWYVWELEVKFKYETQKVFFAFLNINGQYVLGDID